MRSPHFIAGVVVSALAAGCMQSAAQAQAPTPVQAEAPAAFATGAPAPGAPAPVPAATTADAGTAAAGPAAPITPPTIITSTVPALHLDVLPATFATGRAGVVDITVPATAPPIAAMTAALKGRRAICTAWSLDGRRWRVIAPVGIEDRPGAVPFKLTVELVGGKQLVVDQPLTIEAAPYEERAITVDKQFLAPSRQAARARKEARALDQAFTSFTAERLWRGSFAKPVLKEETSPFGIRRTYNKKRKSRHLGLDLDGVVGDPITSAQRGRVALAAERFYSGGTVLLDHGEGLFSMYFHMSRIDVKVGDVVEKGQGLGLVGKSGQVTGPHLHFSVKLSGQYLDPAQLLRLDLSADPLDVQPPPAPQ